MKTSWHNFGIKAKVSNEATINGISKPTQDLPRSDKHRPTNGKTKLE